MEIKRGNTVVCDVYLKDNSYTVEEIMGEFSFPKCGKPSNQRLYRL